MSSKKTFKQKLIAALKALKALRKKEFTLPALTALVTGVYKLIYTQSDLSAWPRILITMAVGAVGIGLILFANGDVSIKEKLKTALDEWLNEQEDEPEEEQE